MTHLNIKFLRAQMASLEYGQQTEDEVCRAIEAEVCDGIFHDRQQQEKEHQETTMQEEEKQSVDKFKKYPDFDPYVDYYKPEGATTDTKK
jgi:hypothetical protein